MRVCQRGKKMRCVRRGLELSLGGRCGARVAALGRRESGLALEPGPGARAVLTCLAVNGIPTSTSLNFAQVTKVSFGSQLFPTSGFCSCCFLCLECVSFCFSHDQVFLILQILTDMWFPQQSLPGPYYWKSISPFTLLCIPLHSLFLLSFVIICSFGCLLFRYSTIQTMGAGLVSVLSPLSLQCPVESEAGDRWVQGWAARVCSLWTVALWQR